jgi:hypothetical protein
VRRGAASVMVVTAVATSGRIPATATDRGARMVAKTPESCARSSDPRDTRAAHKPGKPRPLMEPAVAALPGETVPIVALRNRNAAVPLPDWPYRHPLALPTVIRTVNIVLPNGATLDRESGPLRCGPVPRDRIPQSHPESGRGAG